MSNKEDSQKLDKRSIKELLYLKMLQANLNTFREISELCIRNEGINSELNSSLEKGGASD